MSRNWKRCSTGAPPAPDGIISIGIAGALAPGLPVGQWVVADAVLFDGEPMPTDPAWTSRLAARLPEAATGTVARRRTRWWRRRRKRPRCIAPPARIAVDMESHIAARVARRHGLPFAAARVVSDAAHRTLPPAARVGMKPDGTMDLPAVLRSLLASPGQLPALIRTGLRGGAGFRRATPRPPPSWPRARRPGSRPACCSTWPEKTNSAGRWLSSEMSLRHRPSVRTPRAATDSAFSGWRIMSRHRRGLEAAMDHAVGALLVVADAILVPLGVVHQLAEGLGVALAQQVAGLLPAEHGARRVAPRRAVIGLVAGQEVQEHARLGERPFPSAIAARSGCRGTVPWSWCG